MTEGFCHCCGHSVKPVICLECHKKVLERNGCLEKEKHDVKCIEASVRNGEKHD